MRVLVTKSDLFEDSGRQKIKGLKITTIILGSGEEKFLNFRCPKCGIVLFQYSDKEVSAIFDSAIEVRESSSIDVRCRMCKRIYRIIE